MVRLENLELEHRDDAQEELQELARLLAEQGASVEVAGPDESVRARLQESVGGTAIDVLNVVFEVGKDVTPELVTAAILAWAKKRRRFRGERPDDRPQARLWVVEDGREYDYAIDLDSEEEPGKE